MQLPARVGKYELEELLGGGMSEVFRARDTVIGRTVAVKLLTAAGCQDPELKTRFLSEARIAGSLVHDNILSIYDFGQDETGRPFMVLEFLHGEDLSHAIRNGHTGDLRNKLNISLQIARALEFIHTQQIVHRDIKPANVHVNGSGVVKLMDFGIAKTEGLQLTRAGCVLGTPFYMAPEQIEGQRITAQVDVYAFGVMLFEIITGLKPVSGDAIERILYSILYEPLNLQPLFDVGTPQPVCELIASCTQKNPAERPQGFTPLRVELERIIAELDSAKDLRAEEHELASSQKLPVNYAHLIWRRCRILAPPLAVVLVALVGYLWWGSGDAEAKVISKASATYTREAASARLQGSVILDAVIDEHGRVQDVRVVQGLGMGLDESAVAALRDWRFRPAYHGGKAVPTPVSTTFVFKLNSR